MLAIIPVALCPSHLLFLSLMSFSLSKAELSDVRECFDYFDRNRDGKLEATELGVVLRSLGALVSEQEIKELSNGLKFPLDWESFLPLAVKKMRQGSDALDSEILKAFQVFDVRGRGKVAVNDLRRFLTTLGEALSDEDLNEALKFSGIPHDQPELSYADFLRTVKGATILGRKRGSAN